MIRVYAILFLVAALAASGVLLRSAWQDNADLKTALKASEVARGAYAEAAEKNRAATTQLERERRAAQAVAQEAQAASDANRRALAKARASGGDEAAARAAADILNGVSK